VIFATVGTERFPFPRLIHALERLTGEDVIVQYGHSPPPLRAAAAFPFVPFPEMHRLLETASVVITHAGVGSILLALRAGHMPIVVPRLRRYREHVDDHQLELAHALERSGRVLVVEDVEALHTVLAQVSARRSVGSEPPSELAHAVRRRLWDDGGAPLVTVPRAGGVEVLMTEPRDGGEHTRRRAFARFRPRGEGASRRVRRDETPMG
jgi:UDP-N-acetylglucosamine transferase subunit ALG13